MSKIFRRYSLVDKEQLCASWQVSGLSQSEVCRQQGLKIATFNTWLKSLSRSQKSNFIPISLKSAESKSADDNDVFEIRISNMVIIRVPVNVGSSLVLQMIRELNKCI